MESPPPESAASRLLHLLSLLTSRSGWTASELADRLGVTTRTVRRDVTALRDLGYPVESEPGRTGGYRLGADGRLPPLLLSGDEAVAVAIGLRVATTHGIAEESGSSASALAKLEQVLPPVLRERVRALHLTTDYVPRRSAPPEVDPAVLLAVASACRRHERLTFTHRSGGGERARRVEPYRIVSVDQRWYAVVWDLDRRDWRTFRLDRVRGVVATGHTFEPVPEPDATRMVVEGIARFPYDVQAEVLLDLPHDVAREAVGPTVGVVEPTDDGRTRLTLGADDCAWIARYLASLGCGFEVVTPPELRTAVRDLGDRLRALSGTEDR